MKTVIGNASTRETRRDALIQQCCLSATPTLPVNNTRIAALADQRENKREKVLERLLISDRFFQRCAFVVEDARPRVQ